MTNSEVSLINHILKTKDLITPLASNVDQSIDLYQEEWEFIKEHWDRYNTIPANDVFFGKFPGVEKVKTEGVIEFYIHEVHQDHARRQLQELIYESASLLKDSGPLVTIQKLNRVVSKLSHDTRMIKDIDIIASAEERLETFREGQEIRKSGRGLLGISSGIRAIDDNFGGWQSGDLITIAGWSGNMKSFLALYFAVKAWLDGYRVLYFSLEMGALQIGYRFDTLLSGMLGGDLSNAALMHALESIEYDQYKRWLTENLNSGSSFVVVSNEELEEVNQNTVMTKIEQHSPDYCVIDYIQLMDDASGVQGETERIKNLSKALKRVAMKTKVPITVITSVTQDKKDLGAKAPELEDMAWSKQLAYDSDLTLATCKKGDNYLEIAGRKNRRGSLFNLYLNWDVDRGLVRDIFDKKEIDRLGSNDEKDSIMEG